MVTEQEDVLHHIKQYYETLFKSHDNLETTAFKIFDILGKNKYYFDIGGELTIHEVSNTLKKMKSHKTPGIDGITVEFLKVFWLKLKYIVTNALNCCYNKGCLSTSLRQSIITYQRSLIVKKLASHFITLCHIQISLRLHCRKTKAYSKQYYIKLSDRVYQRKVSK